MDQDALDRMTDQVLELCSLHSRAEVRLDLEKTMSAQITLNRIWDDQFLHGTTRDPRQPIPIDLDSDDEPDTLVISSPTSQPPPTNPPTETLSTQDLFNDPFESDDSLPSPDQLLSQICSGSVQRKRPSSTQPFNSRSVITLDDDDGDDALSLTADNPQALKDWEDDFFGSQSVKEWDDGPLCSQTIDSQQSVLSAKEQKKKEREEKALRRTQEQEAKKREREKQKAEKAAAKELEKRRQQANRLRTNKNELLAEMIVDVSDDFLDSSLGNLVKIALESKEADVRTMTETTPYTISWRRKCNADWDGDSQQFVPYENGEEIRIKSEDFVLVFLEMDSICGMIQQKTVDQFVDRIKASCASRQIIIMVEGLESYYKKKMNVQRRQFENIVLESIQRDSSDDASDTARRPRKKKRPSDTDLAETGPSKEAIEETLTYLQIVKDVMLVPTLNEEDSASWITCLTADMAHARYRTGQPQGLGKSRCGADPQDTWTKMLEEIQLCTPAVSKSVVESYPTLQSLHHAYRQLPADDAQLLLADLEVQRSAVSARDRRVNSAMSKKIYAIFTSDDDKLAIA